MPKDEPAQKLESGDYFGLFIAILLSAAATAFLLSSHEHPAGHVIIAWAICLIIGVICHELGHALAYLAVGGSVEYIQLGQAYPGKTPWTFHLLGFAWHVYSVPMSGQVHGSLYSVDHFRLHRCLVIAGGPLTNAILLGVGLTFINTTQFDGLSEFLIGWNAANGVLLATSVVPMTIRHRGKSRPNDGMLFWRTLLYTHTEVTQFVEGAHLRKRIGKDLQFATELPLEQLFELFTKEPSNPAYGVALLTQLHEANDPRYLDCLLKVLDQPKFSGKLAVMSIDSYLTWQLHHGAPERAEIADQLSLRLVAEEPSISTNGTRGSVLIDIGRVEEGKAMLQDVLTKSGSKIDKSYSNIFLALAARAEGNFALAREYAETAAKIDPACPALKRVADLLPADQRWS
jgi:Peptidase family M50